MDIRTTGLAPKNRSTKSGFDREPRSVLDSIRATIGEYNFAGQYLQAPSPPGGGMIKRAWFQTYPSNNTPGFEYTVQSWDTAIKATELADYSVCTVWGIKDNNAYLRSVYRARLDYPALKKMVIKMRNEWLAEYVVIEDKGSGQQLIQELHYNGIPQVHKYNPIGDKIVRMHTQSAIIESGRVFLPDQASWLDAYLHEMTTFPSGRHDDQVDSTSQFLHWHDKLFNFRIVRVPGSHMMR
jgi:predicted phage terminase large subunit-like protein